MPVFDRDLQLLLSGASEPVETRAAIVFGHAPVGADPTGLLQFEERRVQGALIERELLGLPFLLLHALYKGAQKGRYKWCEAGWILESNRRMNAIMPYWDAYVYKRYRIYEKAL